jgi:hypothetical protein
MWIFGDRGYFPASTVLYMGVIGKPRISDSEQNLSQANWAKMHLPPTTATHLSKRDNPSESWISLVGHTVVAIHGGVVVCCQANK